MGEHITTNGSAENASFGYDSETGDYAKFGYPSKSGQKTKFVYKELSDTATWKEMNENE